MWGIEVLVLVSLKYFGSNSDDKLSLVGQVGGDSNPGPQQCLHSTQFQPEKIHFKEISHKVSFYNIASEASNIHLNFRAKIDENYT